MNTIINSLQNIVHTLKLNLYFTLILLGILWAIHIVNYIMGYRLSYLGIHPRKLAGIPGIVLSPLLHGNFEHLLLNSIPLFVLVDLLLAQGKLHFYTISIEITIISGVAIWLLGRRAIHIGASSLIMGYFGYLLAIAWHHPTTMTVVLAVLGIFYLGSLMLTNLLSFKKGVSAEGHIFGFLAGILVAYVF
ncbi:MAG: rhomboid family intramembrane serine protease [Gammaproteobacteria bacterium]|nr:rhomboid family intramembrane serine protease [Gammaproteobacteria bacterium]